MSTGKQRPGTLNTFGWGEEQEEGVEGEGGRVAAPEGCCRHSLMSSTCAAAAPAGAQGGQQLCLPPRAARPGPGAGGEGGREEALGTLLTGQPL